MENKRKKDQDKGEGKLEGKGRGIERKIKESKVDEKRS